MATYRKLPSGQWQARIWHPGARKYVPLGFTHPLKKVVKQAAEDAEARIRRGEWIDPARGMITLGEWWEIWSAMRTIESSTAHKDDGLWCRYIRDELGDMSLAAITTEDVETWRAATARRVGASTVAQAQLLLAHMLDRAVHHKRIVANPAGCLPPVKVPKHVDRFLTPAEERAVKLLFKGQDRLMVEVLLGTGLRWAELAGLQVFRVDVDRKMLTVAEVGRRDGSLKAYPKSQAGQRRVPLTAVLARKLAWHMAGKAPRDRVFTSPFTGGPVRHEWWHRRRWRPAIEASGLAEPLPRIHDLRHTYGSRLAERGMSSTDIRDLMGHASLRATERYLHAAPTRFDRARDVLENWHGGGTPRLRTVDGGKKDAPDLRGRESG